MAGRTTRGKSQRPTAVRFESGGTVRHIRLEAGVGVRELARRIGCSPGLISRIEAGTVAPSVHRLYAIANELGVSVDALLYGYAAPGQERDAEPAAAFDVVRDKGDGSIELPGGVRWRLLAGADGSVEFREVSYEPGAMSSPPGEFLRHAGHEYGYVVEGRFLVQIGFEQVELGAGDSISLPAQAPHRLSNPGDTPARAVWIIAANAGDPHVHAERQAATHRAH
jgi:transcriptional regulator with XRE-family HTH domain